MLSAGNLVQKLTTLSTVASDWLKKGVCSDWLHSRTRVCSNNTEFTKTKAKKTQLSALQMKLKLKVSSCTIEVFSKAAITVCGQSGNWPFYLAGP